LEKTLQKRGIIHLIRNLGGINNNYLFENFDYNILNISNN